MPFTSLFTSSAINPPATDNRATCEDAITRLTNAIHDADTMVVGAGSGMSTSAGYTYSGERFERYFSDFARTYGIGDMYSGGFAEYPDRNTYWAWWSRSIYINRYMVPPKDTYGLLRSLLDGHDYTVITTNVDHCLQRAGFPDDRLFCTQGDYGLFQSSRTGTSRTYDNERDVKRMLLAQGFTFAHMTADTADDWGELIAPDEAGGWAGIGMTIPDDLIPYCPDDGFPMAPNLRCDDTFAEDETWHECAERYQTFLDTRRACEADGSQTLFLDLGSGGNTPIIFKFPFMQWTSVNRNATYASINLGEAVTAPQIVDRSVLIDADIDATLRDVASRL